MLEGQSAAEVLAVMELLAGFVLDAAMPGDRGERLLMQLGLLAAGANP